MGENVVKLPVLGWDVPKPKKWDFVACTTVVVSALLAGYNLSAALGQAPGEAVSGLTTTLLVLLQLGIATLSLFVLGKTAKEGTLWGNLAAVTGMLVAVGAVLLAAALWAAA